MRPIILVHGFARPDILFEMVREQNIPGFGFLENFQYFNGIAKYLEENGFTVLSPNLKWTGASIERAQDLKDAILPLLAETGADKVDLIAHSMGGIDSRRMINDLDMADKIASLTTIGTPHLGTALASLIVDHGGDELIRVAKAYLGADLEAGLDLTEEVSKQYNIDAEEKEAKNNVFYQTYCGFQDEKHTTVVLLPAYKIILKLAGPNDGLIPADSQRWTDVRRAADGTEKKVVQKDFPFPADHLNQIGWWDLQEREHLFELENPFRQKREFEQKVKDVYLGIARDVQNL
jgi:triacylglycerol lipase